MRTTFASVPVQGQGSDRGPNPISSVPSTALAVCWPSWPICLEGKLEDGMTTGTETRRQRKISPRNDL